MVFLYIANLLNGLNLILFYSIKSINFLYINDDLITGYFIIERILEF